MKLEIVKKLLVCVIAFWCILGAGVVISRIITFADAAPPSGDFDTGYARQVALTLLHVLPAFLFVTLGPFQFIAKIRNKYRAFHRWSGRVYILSSALLGISALILSLVVGFGGLIETVAVLFYTTIFLVSLAFAVYRISRHQVAAHREWMIRVFSLGLSVVTMRLIFVMFKAFIDHEQPTFFGITLWLAFSLHLVLAEIWINITRPSVSLNKV
jgi:uncharacterized membrane protein